MQGYSYIHGHAHPLIHLHTPMHAYNRNRVNQRTELALVALGRLELAVQRGELVPVVLLLALDGPALLLVLPL